MDSLLAKKCEMTMACGGQGICATCHVYVREGSENLSPITNCEKRTLGLITGARVASRLACQARVMGDGVVVEIPQAIYVDAANDLLSLVGRRSDAPILHPKDARVLIEKGKIITKSRILELQNDNFSVLENTVSRFKTPEIEEAKLGSVI